MITLPQRVEDMDAEQLAQRINDLKTSNSPLHEIELVSIMYIAEAMKKLGVKTVRELLDTVPSIH